MIILSQTQLIECTFCSAPNAIKYISAFNTAMEKYEIDTALRQAHFLSQVAHESGSLIYTEEIASGAAYENRADLGNTRKGDGVRFKGRGFIQITGRANYQSYGSAVKMDFESYPELLSKLPYVVDSAAWFWDQNNLNIFADANDIKTITHRINGGLNGLQDRESRLHNCKKVFGIA